MGPLMGYAERAVMGDNDDRILRLESVSQEQATSTAALSVKVEYVSAQIDEVRQDLSDQIERGMSSLGRKVDELVSTSAPLIKRVEKLEASESEREQAIQTRKKILMAVVLAGSGVVGTKLAEFFLLPLVTR